MISRAYVESSSCSCAFLILPNGARSVSTSDLEKDCSPSSLIVAKISSYSSVIVSSRSLTDFRGFVVSEGMNAYSQVRLVGEGE